MLAKFLKAAQLSSNHQFKTTGKTERVAMRSLLFQIALEGDPATNSDQTQRPAAA